MTVSSELGHPSLVAPDSNEALQNPMPMPVIFFRDGADRTSADGMINA